MAPDPVLAEAAVAAARATGDPVLISGSLDARGVAAARAGRLREAHRIASERLVMLSLIDRRRPQSAAEILDIFHSATMYAVVAGELPAALAAARLILRDDLVGAHPYRSTSKMVPPLVLMGRFDEALPHVHVMWDAWQRSGTPAAVWMSPAVSAVALAHGLRGDEAGYRRWRHRAERAMGVGDPVHARNNAAFAAFVDARVAVHTASRTASRIADDADHAAGDPAAVGRASALVARSFADFPPGRHETYARAAGAELAVVAGLPDAAERIAAAAPGAAENARAAACLTRAAGRLHGDPDALAAALDGWERIGAGFEHAHTLALLTAHRDRD